MRKHTKPVVNSHIHLFQEHEEKISDFTARHEHEKISKVDVIRAAITHFFNHAEKSMLQDIKKEKE